MREEPESDADETTDVLEGAWPGGGEKYLQFGEGLLNRIEIGALGRREPQEGAGPLNGGPDFGLLAGRKVVEDDHVAASHAAEAARIALMLFEKRGSLQSFMPFNLHFARHK